MRPLSTCSAPGLVEASACDSSPLIQLCLSVVHRLHLCRWATSDLGVQTAVVPPVDALERGEFDLLRRSPRPLAVDEPQLPTTVVVLMPTHFGLQDEEETASELRLCPLHASQKSTICRPIPSTQQGISGTLTCGFMVPPREFES